MSARPSNKGSGSVWVRAVRLTRCISAVLFGVATGAAGAHEPLPSDIGAQRQALELRVSQVRQAFGASVMSGDSRRGNAADETGGAEPTSQWGNWPNWGNWNNWNNWANWGNWFNR